MFGQWSIVPANSVPEGVPIGAGQPGQSLGCLQSWNWTWNWVWDTFPPLFACAHNVTWAMMYIGVVWCCGMAMSHSQANEPDLMVQQQQQQQQQQPTCHFKYMYLRVEVTVTGVAQNLASHHYSPEACSSRAPPCPTRTCTSR